MDFLLRWGRSILEWGSSFLTWGSGTDAPLLPTGENATHLEYAFDIEFETGESNWWTGNSALTIGNKTYHGMGNIVSVGAVEGSDGEPQARVQLQFTIKDQTIQKELLQYPGRVPVTIHLAYSNDGGETFLFSPQSFRGIALNHRIIGNVYSIDIVDETQIRSTIDQVEWSHQEQSEAYPGDLGFEHLITIATEGVPIRWPN